LTLLFIFDVLELKFYPELAYMYNQSEPSSSGFLHWGIHSLETMIVIGSALSGVECE
jgi:hypothetical protein